VLPHLGQGSSGAPVRGMYSAPHASQRTGRASTLGLAAR